MKLRACLGYERAGTRDRLRRVAVELGLTVVHEWNLLDQVPEPAGAGLVIIEDHAERDVLLPRTRSLAAAEPEALLILVVSAPKADIEQALRDEGAFDVLDDGPDLERELVGAVQMARRFFRLYEERALLASDLAHRERLSALGILAAGVGHEINNPCTAILANVSVVRDDFETLLARPRYQQGEFLSEHAGEWLEALGDCISASRRITAIVSTLTLFSRKTAKTEPEPVQLNDAVATVLRLVGKEIGYQAAVELRLSDDLPPVLALPHTMLQVVTNLVVNALQALGTIDRPDKRLTIRTSSDESTVLLEVADNGPGIPQEHLGRVFDPFFTTKAGSGSGLGLSITREIVVRAGGEIFVESSATTGARFRVILPRPEARATLDASRQSYRPTSARLRVMIVDDDELLLRSLTRSLRDRFECIPVNSVSAALTSLAKDDRIDAVLADIVMPGQTGIDLFDELQRTWPRLAARTVFFSGGISSERLQTAIDRTGRPLLDKPVDIHHLIKTVREVAT